jgi:hypothetical protein
MPLISNSIPNLINGVSQQPYALRLASQCEAQENGFSSVVEGLKKRPMSEYIAKLEVGTLTTPFLHTINRDLTERYIMTAQGLNVKVYELDGTEKTVNFEDVSDVSLTAIVATGSGTAFEVHQRSTVSTIQLVSAGITTATVIWEKSATGLWAGEETTVRTDTADTDGTVAWTAGDFIRARCSAWTSGTITATITSSKANYLNVTNQRDSLQALSVADNTFLVNKTVVPAMTADLTTVFGEEYLIFIKAMPSAAYSSATTITVDGTTVTPSFDIDQVDYAANIMTALAANGTINGAFTFSRERTTIRIKKDDGTAFEMKADNARDDHVKIIKKKTQRFTDLPVIAPTGMVIEVIGDQSSSFDNYFVKFQPDNDTATFDTGLWIETVKEGITSTLDKNLMPHLLVRESDGTFTFKRADWGERMKGDELSAPVSSFIGQKINGTFFFKNRIGFLADTNVIMSEAGEFFNFFPTTVTTLLNSDPIDVATSGSSGDGVSVPILRHAVPFDENLLVFSDQTQFTLTGGTDGLTPRSVAVDVTTEFETGSLARPVNAGKNLYFPSNDGDYSRMREYFVDGETGVNDAADITAHCPKYVPKDIRRIAVSTTSDILLCLSNEDTQRLYVYKYFWSGNEKLQSSWSRWDFNGAIVHDISIIGNSAFMVMQYADAVYLQKMDLDPGRVDNINSAYLSTLDRRVDETVCTVAYDAGTNLSTITLPYVVSTATDLEGNAIQMRVVTRQVTTEAPGVRLQNVTVTDVDELTVDGDQTATKFYVGEAYKKSYTFSTQVLKEADAGGSEKVIGDGRLQLRTWSLVFDNTGYFVLKITPAHTGETSSYPLGIRLGTVNSVIGTPPISSGTFKVPVLAKNDEVTITVENDTHLPSHLLSAEWEGFFTLRADRYRS